jgi:hypothetical protein
LNKDVTGFVYTDLTCAFDTLLTAFLVIYQSESSDKKAVFEKTMPILTNVFDRVLDKSLTYADAKENLLSTFFFTGERFKPGRFQKIGDVMESVLKSQIIMIEEEDENYFQLNYYQQLTCHSEVCLSRNPKVIPDTTNSVALHTDLDHTSSINNMVNEFFQINRRHYTCSTCNIKMDEQWFVTKLPRVLYVALCGEKIKFDIDRQITINNVAYKLIVVVYSGSGHFMCRMIVNNDVVEYDGMTSNGSFRKVDPINAFYGDIIDLRGIQREAFQILYKRQDENM